MDAESTQNAKHAKNYQAANEHGFCMINISEAPPNKLEGSKCERVRRYDPLKS